jgi:hypothetical protein
LFQNTAARSDPFPTPDFLFATMVSKHSDRSVETVTPPAKALKLDVNAEDPDAGNATLNDRPTVRFASPVAVEGIDRTGRLAPVQFLRFA